MSEELTFSEEEINEGKGLAWLSYFGLFLLIPLLAQKENKYSQFHAKQGLALLLYYLGFIIVMVIIGVIAGAIDTALVMSFGFPICLTLSGILWIVGLLGLGVLAIIGIIQSLSGKAWKMPFGIYALSTKFNF